MKTIQERTLAKIESLLEGRGYSLAVAYQYANNGDVLVFTSDDEVTPLAKIGFNFQSNTYRLSLTVRGKRIPSQEEQADYDFYQNYSKPTRFWEVLDEHLPVTLTQLFPLNCKVRLKQSVERFPHFSAPANSTGVVVQNSSDGFYVKMDKPLKGAEEWDNQICWVDDEIPDDVMADVERVDPK